MKKVHLAYISFWLGVACWFIGTSLIVIDPVIMDEGITIFCISFIFLFVAILLFSISGNNNSKKAQSWI